jgi:class 3 adenylate cyclase
VTFLFTDIEGSTRLWDQHPDEMRVALEADDALHRNAVEAQGGYVFATGGDGFCVAFQRASTALEGARRRSPRSAADAWFRVLIRHLR